MAGSIPDIEGDRNAPDLNSFDFEVNADGAEVVVLEGVLAVAEEESCFADSAVAHNQKFESTGI